MFTLEDDDEIETRAERDGAMTMPDVQGRLRTASYAVPKPLVAFALASGAWLVVCALCIACMNTLSLIGF